MNPEACSFFQFEDRFFKSISIHHDRLGSQFGAIIHRHLLLPEVVNMVHRTKNYGEAIAECGVTNRLVGA